MKRSKWLLILVLILLIINAVFFTAWYAMKGKERVTTALESFLGKTLQGKVDIDQLSINERQITANGLTFTDNEGIADVKIRQVQIRYNLLRLFSSGFKINKVIQQVTIYEPDLFIRFDLKPPKEEKKETKIPDLTPYFDLLEIKHGNLHIIFTAKPGKESNDTIRIEEKLTDINISVTNRKFSDIRLGAVTANQGKINASGILDNGHISRIEGEIEKYMPYSISMTGFEQLETGITARMEYSQIRKEVEPEYSLYCTLAPTNIIYKEFAAVFSDIQIQANPHYIYFNVKDSSINSHRFRAGGYLSDYLENPFLNADVTVTQLDLSTFTTAVSGYGSGRVKVEGSIKDLIAGGTITFPEVGFLDETVTNLKVDARFANMVAYFTSEPFTWRNQLTSTIGSFDINTLKLDLDVSTSPVYYDEVLNLTADLNATLEISDVLKAAVEIRELDFYNSEASLKGFGGQVAMSLHTGEKNSIQVDLSLSNKELSIIASGDPLNRDAWAELELKNVFLENYLLAAERQNIDARISGLVRAQIKHSDITGNTELSINMNSPKLLKGEYLADFSYNLDTRRGELDFYTRNAEAEDIPFDFALKARLEDKELQLLDLNLDNTLSAQGWFNLDDYFDSGVIVVVDSLNISRYWKMFNPGNVALPDIGNISLAMDYNLALDRQIRGLIQVDSILLPQLKPLGALINFTGSTSTLNITADISTPDKAKLSAQGTISRHPGLEFKAQTELKNFNLNDYIATNDFSGLISGKVDWSMFADSRNEWQQNLAFNLAGSDIEVMDIPIDFLRVKASQLDEVLEVDSLLIFAVNQFDISANGALDYNLLTNKYTEGNNSLTINLEAEMLRMIRSFVPYFTNARGRLISQLTLQTSEDGIVIPHGSLNLSNGMLRMQDQVESFSNIDLEATITQNELKIDRFSCQVGNGRLFIRNEIDPGGDNFFIGPINLGYLLIHSSDPGIQISVPGFLPVNTFATAVVKGQNGKEATIKGPFDDMEISAEIIASNGSAVYPANTKNLLQMINVFQRRPEAEKEMLPLPFTLDLLVKIADNVHYVTYPANLICLPGSYLRLNYDGNEFSSPEADFISEAGTLDFYGTIFRVERVRLYINEANNIMSVNGTLTRNLSDGTVITLSVVTNPEKGPDILNQLEFNLTSDNPQDRTNTQILSRLRYNRNIEELSPDQRQSLLQDEAMQLISTSVSTTYVSQFLSPIENSIRRFLRLDSFSITTGFVQNLFVEFVSGNGERDVFSGGSNVNADILQFSSSILLNNLSLTIGKYLGSSVFLDYEINLQETTDLAQKTKLDLYHNASLRFNLPWRLRFVYTFSIRPAKETNTHEVMLQRSFRF